MIALEILFPNEKFKTLNLTCEHTQMFDIIKNQEERPQSESLTKVLFTYEYTRHNFPLQLLRLVNITE